MKSGIWVQLIFQKTFFVSFSHFIYFSDCSISKEVCYSVLEKYLFNILFEQSAPYINLSSELIIYTLFDKIKTNKRGSEMAYICGGWF